MSNNILDKLLKSIVRKLQIFYLKNELSENIFDRNDVSNFAFNSIIQSRGKDKPPALIIHGVRHRSGTVFAGEILRLHPDLYAYPNEIWEIPFLKCSNDLLLFQDNFFEIYRPNKNKIGENDFQSIFGSAFISYLYSFAPEGKRLLLKTPWVENLNLFFTYFPNENLICLLRDGRDVVHSTIKTWGKKKFAKVCKSWNESAKTILACHEHYSKLSNRYLLFKYEDIVRSPIGFAETCCETFKMDIDKFPVDKVEKLPVRGSSAHKVNGKVIWDAVEKSKKFKSSGHWEKWTGRQKATFKKIAGKTLIQCGYCDDLDW